MLTFELQPTFFRTNFRHQEFENVDQDRFVPAIIYGIMSQRLLSEFPSPLEGFENAEPLPEEKNEDGKSFKNASRDDRSQAYDSFAAPLDNGPRGGL